ncbi:MAG: EndoU domain-containing protein, partial [Flavobacteriaceae bacterium]
MHQAYEAKQAEYAQVDDVFKRLSEGSAFNPKDTNERLAVSKAYEAAAKGGDLFGNDPSARDTALYLAGNTGIVPDAVLSTLRGAFASDDPARIAAATRLAVDLNDASPDALTDAGAGAIAGIGTEYARLTTEMGLSPEQASGQLGEQVRKAGAAGPDAWIDKDGRLNINIWSDPEHRRQLQLGSDAANASASATVPTRPDISAAVAGAATAGDWAGTLGQGAEKAARQAAPVLGKGAAAVLGKVLFFLSPILDATETGGRIDREVTINGIRARVTGFGAERSRTFEIEIDGRTFRFNGSTNRDGDIAAGAGYEIIDGELVPLADFAESWNRLVEHAPAGSGLAMVAQSQSAGGEDDEEEDGKPTTGEGGAGAEDLAADDGETPERQRIRRPDGSIHETGANGGPALDDIADQDADPAQSPDGSDQPDAESTAAKETRPISYFLDRTPIYDDETAPEPDPNDPEDPLWVRTFRHLSARIILKTLQGVVNRDRYYDDDGELHESDLVEVHGGHYVDGETVRIVQKFATNNKGVIEAEIQIKDPITGEWHTKPDRSTVFPTSWSRQRVMYEARKAFL